MCKPEIMRATYTLVGKCSIMIGAIGVVGHILGFQVFTVCLTQTLLLEWSVELFLICFKYSLSRPHVCNNAMVS